MPPRTPPPLSLLLRPRPLIRNVVTRNHLPSWDEFVQIFVRQSQPLLVRNALDRTWCQQHWTVDALWKRLGGSPVAQDQLQSLPNEETMTKDDGDSPDGKEGRLLIPSTPGANYVARCTPDTTTAQKLQQQQQQKKQQQQYHNAHTNSPADSPPQSQKEEEQDEEDTQDSADGQLLIPSPAGVNYVSQYKSLERELPTRQALGQFMQLSRSPSTTTTTTTTSAVVAAMASSSSLLSPSSTPPVMPQGCQCRLDPAAFWDDRIDTLPDLLQELDIIYDNSFVWITSPLLRTSLHPDPDEGMIAHLDGTKRVVLISPVDKTKQDLDDLFQYRWLSGSLTDVYNLLDHAHDHDDNDDDGVRRVQRGATSQQQEEQQPSLELYLVEVNPGDLLYIPKSWLHDVESATETVSLVVRFEL